MPSDRKTSPDCVMADLIDLCDSDDDNKQLSPVRKRLKTRFGKVKTERVDDGSVARLPSLDDDDDDDEIEVIENVQPAFTSTVANKTTGEDDDVEIVGFIGDKLPHMRCHCPDNHFQTVNLTGDGFAASQQGLLTALEQNKKACDLCYCYVCDKPYNECQSWVPPVAPPSTHNAHCMAMDKGIGCHNWKMKRQQVRNPTSLASSSSYGISSNLTSSFTNTFSRGPFPPGYEPRCQDDVTKCRNCGWFSKLWKPAVGAVASCRHWCHKCGRVVERSSNFLNLVAYKKQAADVLVGERVIPFTIHAHDPRKITAYKKSWKENADWIYDESEMRNDAFRQLFCKFVVPAQILACVPVLDKDNLPSDGRFTQAGDDDAEEDFDSDSFGARAENPDVSISETESVVLESHADICLLKELGTFDSFGGSHKNMKSAQVTGHIIASWDKTAQKGTFTVTLYLRPKTRSKDTSASLTKLLGAWFGAFPFPLSSLATRFTARESTYESADSYRRFSNKVSVPPFRFSQVDEEKFREEMGDEIQEAMDSFNGATSESRSKLSLLSSSGETWLGGTTNSTPGDFASFLQGYFSEMLVEDLCRCRNEVASSWLAKKFGVVSSHRNMRNTNGHLHSSIMCHEGDRMGDTYFSSYLAPSEYPLAIENLAPEADNMRLRIKNVATLVQHLENLGHASAPFIEGLTVDLLPFQKESVQWALERELQKGGVQSFLWTELPSVDDEQVDKLYLNPVLNRVTSQKPKLVRGGFICEEMGLGKTIISLALILANPAPALPASGSAVPDKFYEHEGEGLGWDPDLKESITTEGCNLKKGSILSRGTLVVCHVSLVGQWCEEAKSKLQNPGLVYPYHGSGRKRDPKVLAENSIVVTTYATLSSDANYHAKGRDDYCPPCEEVRWWRIICDESHTMRTSSTKQSQAVASLVADHRWAVTGTPINTSLMDLSNQLKLIGIQDVAEYFEFFRNSVMGTVNDHSKAKSRRRGCEQKHLKDNRLFGHFVFFMRNLMMRHTKSQKFLATNIDLMALPAKTERSVEVTLTDEERAEYTILETTARDFYIRFKEQAQKELSKYYLELSSALKVQRVAMSGGHVPMKDEKDKDTEVDRDDEDSVSEEEENANNKKSKKKRANKIVKYSDFAYTSKLKLLIQELTRIRDQEPDSKSLVFSNFSSTLKWLQEELPKHGFTFRHINGQMPQKKRAAALAAFQNDPPTTIFLLSMRSSSCGINLTSANRVFLLEPSLNPAAVAQAIGRVHRIGQKREVEIIRMVVKDSIETRLTEMLAKKYGTASLAEDKGEGDKTPAAVQPDSFQSTAEQSFVGSLTSDRTTVLTQEFDFLFGVKPDNDTAEADEKQGSEDEGMLEEGMPGGEADESATSGMI